MSRMYSRKKGRSGSKKPMKKTAPWLKYKPKEIEEIVARLASQNKGSAEIGTILRDQYGIPTVKLKDIGMAKTIPQIMKDKDAYPPIPEDIFNLMKKAVSLRAHMEKNKRDYTSQRGLEITESKIRRLGKYYRSKSIIPGDWKYDAEKAKLMVR